MSAHAITTKTYATILGVLLALTVITVLAAGVNFGSHSVNVVIALAIATTKGTLVALYFMHLRHDKPLYGIIFVTGLVFLGVLLLLCFVDIGTRDDPRPANLRPPAGASAPARPK
jgi:cytochrome c oxidase subunit IV